MLGMLKFGAILVKEGNPRIQKTIYNFFLSDPQCERFFFRIHELLETEVQQIEASQSQSISEKQNQRFLMNLLEFLRLFCEGHCLELQTYLSIQKRSKKSFDLVDTIAKMLSSVKISTNNYSVVEKIFDALTEFVQGPCKENQKTIAGSKFLEFVHSLLNDDPKIYYYANPLDQDNKDGILPIEVWKTERLKYKSLITLTALLEKMDLSESIVTRIVRTIPIAILKKNLLKIYERYSKLWVQDYTTDSFGWHEEEYDEDDQGTIYPFSPNKNFLEKFECIIENGFNIFILMMNCIDLTGEGENDLNDEEIIEIAKELNQID